MNLLPKSHTDFSQKEYWDSFFKKRGAKAFEWYGEYPELSGYLHKYIKPQDEILITGCGNSSLGRDLYDIGLRKITNIDISQVVIRQMSQIQKTRPDLKYLQMDALNMSFSDDSFTVVLDKGTLDALMPDDNFETVEKIKSYFKEVQRVLKIGGRYICISLLQEHILKIVLDYFPSNHWMFRVVRCFEAESKALENDENTMPVFIIICTKFKSLPRLILEMNLTSSDKMQRFENTSEIEKQIKSVQQAAFVCSGLKRTTLNEDSEVILDLYKAGDAKPRFTVYVVDQKSDHKNVQYAAFIVPQGREAEWLFSTKAGRLQLTKMTKTNRLSIVTLHRGQEYGNLKEVQTELNDAICNLAPGDLKNKKIQYLSLGSDVGKRTIRLQGSSEFSGDYIIEDVEIDNEIYRRLYYLTSQLVIQSEAKLKNIKTKKKMKEIVDLTYLTCKHHIYMIVATHMACEGGSEGGEVGVIGLGGGGLCSFLHKFLPKIQITAVDIDNEMLKIAIEWFGLSLNQQLSVIIKDGIEYLNDLAGDNRKLNAILFDVDSKDTTVGLSCPPQSFLEDDVLNNVVKVINSSGFFVLNLVLRDTSLRPSIINKLNSKFKTVISYKMDEDLNEILICARKKIELSIIQNKLRQSVTCINEFFKKHCSNCENNVEIDEYLCNLKWNE